MLLDEPPPHPEPNEPATPPPVPPTREELISQFRVGRVS